MTKTNKPKPEQMHQALQALARQCDYASTLDGEGFSAFDADWGHKMADSDPISWDAATAMRVWTLCHKYRKQLAGMGVDVDTMKPTEGDTCWKDPEASTLKLSPDSKLIQIVFPYDKALVASIRCLPDREWDRDARLWTVPVRDDAVRLLLRLIQSHREFEVDDDVMDLIGAWVHQYTPVDHVPSQLSRYDVFPLDDDVAIDAPLSETVHKEIKRILKGKWDKTLGVFQIHVNTNTIKELPNVADALGLEVDPAVTDMLVTAAKELESAKELSQASSTDVDLGIQGLGGVLRPFQVAGVSYAAAKKRCLIADEMGLGKTIQALALLQHQDAFPAVVVCPASLKLNWARETVKWLLGKTVKTIWGRKQADIQADIMVVNYSVLKWYVPRFKDMGVKAVILDESHYVKNHKAQRTAAAKELCKGVGIRLLLTGTPILNRPQELISQLTVMDRLNDMGGFWHFANHYCAAYNDGYGLDMSGAQNLDELNDQLRSVCFVRRRKEDVLTELPPKQRTVVPVDITNGPKYRRAHADVVDWLRSDARITKEFLTELTRDHPADEWKWRIATWRQQRAEAAAGPAEALVRIEVLKQLAAEGKLKAMVEWITDTLEKGEKLVVFAHHKIVQHALLDALADWRPVHILGEDSAQDRQRAVDAFQNSNGVRLVICSLKAAGVGLTLTAASHVMFAELGWTPAEHDQAEDRLHRIGQEGSVNCWYLVGQDTVEDMIWKLLEDKRQVVNQATDGVAPTKDVHMLKDLLADMAPGWEERTAALQERLHDFEDERWLELDAKVAREADGVF